MSSCFDFFLFSFLFCFLQVTLCTNRFLLLLFPRVSRLHFQVPIMTAASGSVSQGHVNETLCFSHPPGLSSPTLPRKYSRSQVYLRGFASNFSLPCPSGISFFLEAKALFALAPPWVTCDCPDTSNTTTDPATSGRRERPSRRPFQPLTFPMNTLSTVFKL